MTIQAPTRITIEIHPPEPPSDGASVDASPVSPIVRVVAPTSRPQPVIAGAPREEAPFPVAYVPGPCLCLDDEDCGADHANE